MYTQKQLQLLAVIDAVFAHCRELRPMPSYRAVEAPMWHNPCVPRRNGSYQLAHDNALADVLAASRQAFVTYIVS